MQRALQLIVIHGFSIKRVGSVLWISQRVVFHLRLSKLLWDDAHRVSGAIGAGIAEP